MDSDAGDRRAPLAPLAWAALALLGTAAISAAVGPPGAAARDATVAGVLGATAVTAAVLTGLAARASERHGRSVWVLACAGSVAGVVGAVWIATAGTGPALFFDPVTAAITTVTAILMASVLIGLIPTASADVTARAGWAVDGLLAAAALWLVTWVGFGLLGPLASAGADARAYAALYATQGSCLVVGGAAAWWTLRSGFSSVRWLAAAIATAGAGLALMVWWNLDAASGQLLGPVVVQTLWILAVGMIAISGLRRLAEPRASASYLRDAPPGSSRIALAAATPAAVVIAAGVAGWAAVSAPWSVADRRITMIAGLVLTAAAVARAVMAAADDEDVSARLLIDPLTGLFNGRYLRARLAQEVRASAETGSPLAAAMVDLDDFAAANAACGRAVGDEVLRAIGARLAVEQGPDLIVARTGGDEFTLLMPGSDALSAAERTEAIAAAMVRASEPACRVTASAGVAAVVASAGDVIEPAGLDEMLERADRALYWAKYHGKDSVVRFDPRTMGERFDNSRSAMADQRALSALVRALAAANDAREPSRRDHSRNVARLAVRLGRDLGIGEERLVTLENAALLHDIGLVCVPDTMLDRPRELGPRERDLLEEHPKVGASILAGTEMDYLAPLVAAHHERWDGTGYPAGLAGEAIPLESRIIAACDTYDGATSARPHHGARDRHAGIAALTEGMAGSLDPTVAERLIVLLVTEGDAAW